jgi:hypothetical protein
MPLTRNLYREDEVVAALQFCVLRGRVVEAAFWATEMLDSSMANEFLVAMRTIWRLGFGIGAIGWYKEFKVLADAEALDAAEAIRLVVALCRIGLAGGRDNSLIVLAGTRLGPEQVALCIVPKGLSGVDAFFAAAVLQGRAITAWRALPSVAEGVVDKMAAFKHGDFGTSLVEICKEFPALLVAGLCLQRGDLEKRFTVPSGDLDEVSAALKDWSRLDGRRRRVYAVPAQALYWVSARGRESVYKSTEGELRGSLERPGRLWGSVYWDDVAEKFGGWKGVRSDAREDFYDLNFPDDIPDEWSSADRAKSHGDGVLQPDKEASLQRFLVTWFGASGSVIWNQFDAAVANIDAKNLEDIDAPVAEPVPLNLGRIRRRVTV